LKYLFLISIIIFRLISFAQTPHSYSFSEQHELLPKTIYHLYEDSKRNVWIGTDEGLYKWNGSKLLEYNNSNFSSNYSNIQEDKTGRIWCQNFTGQIFYIQEDSLKLFIDQKKWSNSILDYSVKNYPSIFSTSSFGLIEYNFTSKIKTLHRENAYNDKTRYIIDDNNNTIYYDKVHRLTPHKSGYLYWSRNNLIYKDQLNKSLKYGYFYDENQISTPNIFSFKNKLLLLGNKSLKKNSPYLVEINKDGESKEISLNFEDEITASSMFYDEELNLLLLGTKNGLIVLNKYYQPIFSNNILPKKNISSILKDKEGNYWVATLNDGIHIFSTLDILKLETPPDKQITSILKGTNNSIYLIEEYGDILTLNNKGKVELIGSFNSKIESISFDPFKNEIYAGNLFTSFNISKRILNPNIYGSNIKSISFLDTSIVLTSTSGSSNIRIENIEDSSNTIITSISNSPHFTYRKSENNISFTLRNSRSLHNIFDFKNNIAYISYIDGLFIYNKGQNHQILYNNNPILVTTLSKILNGKFWLTTNTGTLIQIEKGREIGVVIFK